MKLAVVLLLGLCLSIFAIYSLASFSLFDVETVLISRQTSLKMRCDAAVLSRDSGATTSTSYHVAIVKQSERSHDEDVACIVDNLEKASDLKVRSTDRSLVIGAPGSARFYRRADVKTVNGIQIPIQYYVSK